MAKPFTRAALAGAAIIAMISGSEPPAGAHPHYNPIKAVSMVDDDLGPSYGGYGYVASSEAEAAASLQFSCSPDSRRKYFEDYCGHLLAATDDLSKALTESMKALVLEKVRAHAAEFEALQMAAILPNSLSPPSCLDALPAAKAIYQSLPPQQPSDDAIRATQGPQRLLLQKFRAAGSQLSSGNIVRALLLYDHFHQHAQVECGIDPTSSRCTDLTNQIARMQTSFPVLFTGYDRRLNQTTAMASLTDFNVDELRESAAAMLGARVTGDEEQRLTVGKRVYASYEDSNAADALIEVERKVADAAFEARHPDQASGPNVNAALKAALDRLNSAITSLRGHYVDQLCHQAAVVQGRSLTQFLLEQPNTVRQALADMSPTERSLARAALCDTGALDTALPINDCVGVTVSNHPSSTTVNVSRVRSNYPYISENFYSITTPKKPPGAARTISLTVNVVSALSAQDTAQMLRGMSERATAWYNCQTGAIGSVHGIHGIPDEKSCPLDPAMATPPVRFEITYRAVPATSGDRPQIHLWKCYRNEMPWPQKTDCKAVEQFNIDLCNKNIALQRKLKRNLADPRLGGDLDEYLDNISQPPPKAPNPNPKSAPSGPDFKNMSENDQKLYCDATWKGAPPESINREDSGNYTASSSPSTSMHEAGHLMGLPDEYSDPTYPFLPLGDHDSIMAGGDVWRGRLYDRHTKMMLAPLGCSIAGGGATQ